MTVSRPSNLPVWATAGGAVLEPSSGKKTDGWANNERPPARIWNWIENLQYQWLAWLDQQEQASTAGLAAEIVTRAASDTAAALLAKKAKAQRDFVQATTPRDKISFGGTLCAAIASGGTLSAPAHVVVGASGNWSVSRDMGRNWSVNANAGSNSFLACAFSSASGTFMAVGTAGTTYQSDAGVTSWTLRAPDASFAGNFNDILYTALSSRLIAVGENGTTPTIQTCQASAWVAQTVPAGTTALQHVATDGTIVVACGAAGSDGRVIKSSTGTIGITWSTTATISGSGKLIDIVWHPVLSLWFACSTTQVYSSPDLITWTSAGLGGFPTGDALTGLVSLDQCVVAFKHNTSHNGYYCTAYISADGTYWYHHPGFGANGNNLKPQKIYGADPNYPDARRSYALWISNGADASFSISQWKAPDGLL